MKLTRRDFIKLGIGAGLALAANPFSNLLFAGENPAPTAAGMPDMVAIKDGTAGKMFEAGIKEIGGMSRFVKKGQIVVVKPNIGWAKAPSFGATTQPDLVAKIIELCYKEGAKKVYVFDNTCDLWKDCYAKSEIEKAGKDNNAVVVPANKEDNYKKVAVKNAQILKEAKVHELYTEADVVINVPVLKHHGGAQMTASIKNLMGVVWDRRFYHKNGLQQCIAEFANVRKPDLTVIDAYQIMNAHGPRGQSEKDVTVKKMQLIGTDMVALDTAAAKILEFDPMKIGHLPIAEKLGIGTMALDKLNIKKMSV